MSAYPRQSPPTRRLTCGFSLIEVVISMVVVSILFVAAMGTVATAKQHQHSSNDARRGLLLAQGLMAEIMQQAYGDDLLPAGLGPEALEMTGNRSRFDDVDDYHNWSASPPQRKDGNQIPNLAGWKRSVTVTWANPGQLDLAYSSESSIKLITVTVTHNDLPVAQLKALRTQASDE